MTAYDGLRGEIRGWGPAFENLQRRKLREGDTCHGAARSMAIWPRPVGMPMEADGVEQARPMRLICERGLFW